MKFMPYANDALWMTFVIGILGLIGGVLAIVYTASSLGILIFLTGVLLTWASWKLGNMPAKDSPDGK